jgi:hypothetical protein
MQITLLGFACMGDGKIQRSSARSGMVVDDLGFLLFSLAVFLDMQTPT